ncbi:MAG TPA: 50S ribosomal protein L6 [Nitrososphaerales archaeon]|nr:50S ribosomal protein L6 [Nitrososphaerales archaeon]
MATSIEPVQQAAIQMPQGVSATLSGRMLSVKGKLGEAKKNFDKINVNVFVEGNRVVFTPFSAKKKDNVIINTVSSIVRNMVTGVTKGYTYKLKVVYAHFPITVKTKGRQVLVENFVGERSPRVADIVGDCKVSVEGDDVIVNGVSLEDVGQTAANIELATKIKRKDQRIFLDGLYIYHKEEGS